MFNRARIRRDFDEAATRYDAHASLQMNVLRQLLATAGSIAPHATILDAGCGTGALARLLHIPSGGEASFQGSFLPLPLAGEADLLGEATPNLGNPVRATVVPLAGSPHRLPQVGEGTLEQTRNRATTLPAGERACTIIALDNAFNMCRESNHSGNLPVNGDMAQLPFAEASFDLVFSSLALQWALNWQATVKEWLRVLKPGGRLVFSSFGAGTLYELADSFAMIDDHSHISDFVNPDEIAQALKGMVAVDIVTEHYPDLMSLFRHLKGLGARHKEDSARRGLMTPRAFARLEHFYRDNHGGPQGLPVSWNIIYAKVDKP